MAAPVRVTNDHIPIDLVMVVPVSASMRGPKLACLKEACLQVAAQLNSFDRFALVLYGTDDEGIDIAIPFSNRHDNSIYIDMVDNLSLQDKFDSGPDLEPALKLACSLLIQGSARACLSHIILLSDSASIPEDLESTVITQMQDASIAVHVLGYGPTHAVDVLASLAAGTSGTYTYIEDFLSLKDAVSGCLLGLMSICQADIQVDISIPVLEYGMHSMKMIGVRGAAASSIAEDGQCGQAAIPFLCLGEKKELLIKVQFDSTHLQEGMLLEILRASMQFRHLTTLKSQSSSKVHAKLVVPVKRKACVPNPLLLVRSLELLVSDMLLKVLDMITQDRRRSSIRILAETRKVLQSIIANDFDRAAITADPSRALALEKLNGLIEDLTILQRCVASETTIATYGKQFAVQEHSVLTNQRSWTMNTHSQRTYASQISLIKDYCGRGLLLF